MDFCQSLNSVQAVLRGSDAARLKAHNSATYIPLLNVVNTIRQCNPLVGEFLDSVEGKQTSTGRKTKTVKREKKKKKIYLV